MVKRAVTSSKPVSLHPRPPGLYKTSSTNSKNQQSPAEEVTGSDSLLVKIFNTKFPRPFRTLSPVKQGCYVPVCKVSESKTAIHGPHSGHRRYCTTRRC